MSDAPPRGPFWTPVAAALAVVLVMAALGATLTDTGPWYQSLRQPAWKPPDVLFAPAWTTIYALLIIAALRAWRHAPERRAREALIGALALNGFLNVLWSLLFFRAQRPDWALAEVGLLWLSIALLIAAFGRHSRASALLLVPYLAWVGFAALLNLAVVRLNGPFA